MCFPVEISLELMHFSNCGSTRNSLTINGQMLTGCSVAALDFSLELGRDTANINDMRIAGEKLAVVYSNDIIVEHSVESQLLQISNFVKICVDEKQGDESHETFMHRLIQERNLISLFPNIAIVVRIYLCLMCSNSSGETSFSKLKRTKNELRSSMSQQSLNHLSLKQ